MKFHRILAPAVLFLVLQGAPRARAQIAAPYPRVFASERGQMMLKVVPDKKNFLMATATLTRFNYDGTEETLWRKPLVNLPGGVLLSNDWNPYLVTTDSWGNAGGAHALVIYNPQGEVVADLKGDDFLPPIVLPPLKPGELRPIVMDGGGRQWTNNAEISFAGGFNLTTLDVQLFEGPPMPVPIIPSEGKASGTFRKWGNLIRIDLKTGMLTRLTPDKIPSALQLTGNPPFIVTTLDHFK